MLNFIYFYYVLLFLAKLFSVPWCYIVSSCDFLSLSYLLSPSKKRKRKNISNNKTTTQDDAKWNISVATSSTFTLQRSSSLAFTAQKLLHFKFHLVQESRINFLCVYGNGSSCLILLSCNLVNPHSSPNKTKIFYNFTSHRINIFKIFEIESFFLS